MQTFTNEQTISTIKRLVYSGSPSKGTMTTVAGATATGYLRPLSEESSAQTGLQWGTGFTLITEVGVDIRVGDVITIASQDYTVRGRADHNRGFRAGYQKYLLVKPQT